MWLLGYNSSPATLCLASLPGGLSGLIFLCLSCPSWCSENSLRPPCSLYGLWAIVFIPNAFVISDSQNPSSRSPSQWHLISDHCSLGFPSKGAGRCQCVLPDSRETHIQWYPLTASCLESMCPPCTDLLVSTGALVHLTGLSLRLLMDRCGTDDVTSDCSSMSYLVKVTHCLPLSWMPLASLHVHQLLPQQLPSRHVWVEWGSPTSTPHGTLDFRRQKCSFFLSASPCALVFRTRVAYTWPLNKSLLSKWNGQNTTK